MPDRNSRSHDSASRDALALYRGDLLARFFVDASGFEDWLEFERPRLRAGAARAARAPAAETRALIERIRSSNPPSRAALSRPNDADTWEVIRELGRGGMSTVYLARDPKHDRQVALKVMRPELALSLGPERFLREIQVTAQLAHPHILPLIESGARDGRMYLITPYVSGESRVPFVTAPGAAPRPVLAIIQEKNQAQGKPAAQRADVRLDVTAAGRIHKPRHLGPGATLSDR